MTNPKDPVIPTEYYHWRGLTKREYFAVMAMQGIRQIASTDIPIVAALAVAQADALIAELNK